MENFLSIFSAHCCSKKLEFFSNFCCANAQFLWDFYFCGRLFCSGNQITIFWAFFKILLDWNIYVHYIGFDKCGFIYTFIERIGSWKR